MTVKPQDIKRFMMSEIEDTVVRQHQKAMGYLLATAHGLFRSHMAAVLDGTSLHMGHVLLLASLYAQNDLTQVQLAQISGIEKSSIVLFLDALEKDGWVERRRHPTDRRAHCVHLTEDGHARFTVVGLRLAKAESAALAVFDAGERAQLEGLLVRLIGHLEG